MLVDAFTETLHAWQNFYFMTGGAAATLIGLLFVALSLGWHLVSKETDEQFNAFVTPILVYFVSVLVLACVMLVPQMPSMLLGGLWLSLGLLGLLATGRALLGMFRLGRSSTTSLQHWLANIVLPAFGFGLLLYGAMWLIFTGSAEGLYAAALADGVLLVIGVARAWELVVWIGHQPRG